MLGYTVTTMVPMGNGVVRNTFDANLRTGLGVGPDVRFVVSDENGIVVGYCMTPKGHVDKNIEGCDSRESSCTIASLSDS